MNQKIFELPSPAPCFDVLLCPTPRGARLARSLAVDWLRTLGLPYRVTRGVEQIVAELAGNVAAPGRGVRLALVAGTDALRIEVTTGGASGSVPSPRKTVGVELDLSRP